MLDIKLIRNNPDLVRKALAERQDDPGKVDRLLAADAEFRQLQVRIDALRQERNEASKTIGAIKTGRAAGDVAVIQESVRKLGDELKSLEERQREIELERTDPAVGMLFTIPNVPHESVPVGRDEADNPEVRRWGAPPPFAFKPVAHDEIGDRLGMLDLPRAAKLAGTRFVLQTGALARLERALINLMLDLHARHGYTEVMPPAIANEETLTANGNLPKFKDQLFKLEDWPYYLIPTAEVPLTNIRRGEILEATDLPMRMTAFTPCFRSEAGAAGRDTKGILRVHQFDKVELVKIVHPDHSYDEL
ncbi:MAG: serine--tRNA ligase, partial [Cyanobacteria bacterium REEB65]|nr:serine--tRNA ligase [Cyanobacteria bacterium REEB65]